MVFSGIQQAMMAALKSAAENLPPEIQENILNIGQKVASFQAQLDAIQRQNDLIISLLQKGVENGRSEISIRDLPGANGAIGEGS